jgi:hypothetical protein
VSTAGWFAAPQELHDLAFRYGLAVDSRDPAMLAAAFTREGTLRGLGEGKARYTGTAGWERMIAEVSASFGQTMHNVFNQTFDRAADGTVTGLTTGIASHLLPVAEGNATVPLLDFAMRYHNRYALEDGRWKFADRQLEVVWVETRQVGRFDPAMLGRELKGF